MPSEHSSSNVPWRSAVMALSNCDLFVTNVEIKEVVFYIVSLIKPLTVYISHVGTTLLELLDL